MDKINIGEISISEFNLIMKQLSAGQLGECLELFMKFKSIADSYAQKQNQVSLPPPRGNQPTPPNPNIKP